MIHSVRVISAGTLAWANSDMMTIPATAPMNVPPSWQMPFSITIPLIGRICRKAAESNAQ